jgi:hypothetical protein
MEELNTVIILLQHPTLVSQVARSFGHPVYKE